MALSIGVQAGLTGDQARRTAASSSTDYPALVFSDVRNSMYIGSVA